MVETLAECLQAVQAEASMAEIQPQELGACWDKDSSGKDPNNHHSCRSNNPSRHNNHNNNINNGNILVNNNIYNNNNIGSNNNINNSKQNNNKAH